MHPFIYRFFIVFLLLQNQWVFACDQKSPDCPVDTKQWLGLLSSTLVGAFCKSDSIFMRCYEMDQAQCISISLAATDQCVAKSEKDIPRPMPKSEANKWGKEIGGCAGDKLTDKVQLKKERGPECGDQP